MFTLRNLVNLVFNSFFVVVVFFYSQVLLYLHKCVTVQGKGSTGDLFEALADVGQRASSQDLRLVVHDESQGDAEKNLGALVEKTIPDSQDRLQATDRAGSAA